MTQYDTLKLIAPEAEPKLIQFVGARYNGVATADVFAEEALQRILPKEHANEADLLLIEAFDLPQAVSIAKSNDERLPWKQVRITSTGEVAERWHSCPMTATERSRLESVQWRERARLEEQVTNEVRAFEAQRRAELGV